MKCFSLLRTAVIASRSGTVCAHASAAQNRAFASSAPCLVVKRIKRKKVIKRASHPLPSPSSPAATVAAAVPSVGLPARAVPQAQPSPASPPPGRTAAPHASSSSSSSAPVTPEAVGTHVVLAHRLDKLTETVNQLERTLRTYSEATGLAQRQLVVLDRRLVALEQAAETLQTGLATAQRTAGDVVLQQRNTELLVRQLESHVLRTPLTTTTTTTSTSAENTKVEVEEEEEEEEEEESGAVVMGEEELEARIRTLVSEAVEKAVLAAAAVGRAGPPPAPASTAATTASVTKPISDQLAELSQRVERLSLDHLALQRVVPAVVDAVDGSTSTSGNTTTAGHSLVAEVAATLASAAAQPFQDAAGASRPRGAMIVLRNVPRNLSAAEVRALCATKLGHDATGRVVSCVVAQYALPTPTHPKSSLPSTGKLTHVPIVATSKTFEVVFDSPDTARRALTELNRTSVKPAPHLPPQALVAEPAASAEFLDVLTSVTPKDATP